MKYYNHPNPEFAAIGKKKTYQCGKCLDCEYWCDECLERNTSANFGRGNQHLIGESLCWCCANAVPDYEKGRGCEWSMYRQPVPGWEAESDYINDYDGKMRRRYCVIKCPKFVRG